MTEDKKYHIQLAVFEVTNENDGEDEEWDWVQEIDFVPPTNTLEEIEYILTLMNQSFDFLRDVSLEFLKDPHRDEIEEVVQAVEKDLDHLETLVASTTKAIEEMFPK